MGNTPKWETVTKQSPVHENDLMFAFDEDEFTTVQNKHKNNTQTKNSYRPKKQASPRKPITSSSVPERTAEWVPKQRRVRSRSTKSTTKQHQHQHPSHALLARFNQAKYENFHRRCIKQRASNPDLNSKNEMTTLYRFWSHYLRSNFNEEMYQEFKTLALIDANNNQYYGLQCLFRFYSYGLEKQIQHDLLAEFQTLVLLELANNHCYGLEKFWAFLKYRKDQQPIDIHPTISAYLETMDSVEDFRNLETQLQANVAY